MQPNDSEDMKSVRLEVSVLEKTGKVDKNVGGHIIIIKGQIPEYFSSIGKTFDMPVSTVGTRLMSGYSIASSQASNAEKALQYCGLSFDKIDTGNGTVTFIFRGV